MDPRRLYSVFQGLFPPNSSRTFIPHHFKQLETDETLLIPKARAALERYGHQVVIGNTLHNRKYQVVFVSRRSPSPSPISSPYVPDGQHITVDTSNSMVHAPSAPDGEFMESWLHITIPVSSPGTGHAKEIEEDIIQELVKRHDAWIGISTEE
jgi:phosphopantothenate-cysteine ligase